MTVIRAHSKAATLAVVRTAVALFAVATAFGQIPGQGPGPGPSPAPPPIHIPHIGPRPERPQPQASTEGAVYVLLRFDEDDYILPQSDDAAKRLAVFLADQEVPATFEVVGEVARVLLQRQRQDVISAIAQLDVGYNSNTHSQHPTVAEYESNLEWNAGVDEFTRRERKGFEDVAHIFRKAPVAYGQPGLSWAPQVFPALQKWGVRVYLGEGKQVGLRGRPFWYGGLLNIFNIRDGELLRPNADWSNLDEAKARFQDAYLTLTSRKAGGVVSIHFRPSEFVERESWNTVNFRDGANPPPEQWRTPPLKTPQETEKAFEYFEELVRYLKSFPRVQFLSASGAAEKFRDRAQNHVFSTEEVRAIAGQVDADVTFQVGENYNLSASEVFYVINKFLVNIVRKQGSDPLLLEQTPYGPAQSAPRLTAKLVVPWAEVTRAIVDIQSELEKDGQIPSAILMGGQSVPPESYLVGISQAAQSLMQKAEVPDTVTFLPARLAAAEYVADDSPDLWDWEIFPHGFDPPKIMSLAKLQAWTLKPAAK